MATRDPRRNLRAYRNKAARLKARARNNNWPCQACGKPIDYNADYKDRNAFTADHVTPLAQGGHILGQLVPMHRACNASKGDGTRTLPPLPSNIPW